MLNKQKITTMGVCLLLDPLTHLHGHLSIYWSIICVHTEQIGKASSKSQQTTNNFEACLLEPGEADLCRQIKELGGTFEKPPSQDDLAEMLFEQDVSDRLHKYGSFSKQFRFFLSFFPLGASLNYVTLHKLFPHRPLKNQIFREKQIF